MITTKYFGNEVLHDFDGDGRDDTAFLLTQQNSGSGTFYYVVVALNTAHGYVGSTAFFLGDRIAPQTTEMSQDKATPDVLIVNFADRKATDAFTVPPSIGKSVRLKLDTKTMQFGEVVKDFEGEANPSSMTLTMKSWGWVKTTYNNNTMITPKIPSTFILTFTNKATFSASTDCNGAGGEYSINGTKITLTKMMSTMMYCEGSQEQDFTKMLQEVNGYLFTSKGELILTLKNDSGSMIFK
jgi:heat shock protein HslJ